jgi:mRNA interferase RelE/StbE
LTWGDNDRTASVSVTPDALKELASLPRVIRERIGKVFQRLEAWPDVSGAKPLSGNLAGWYRMRTGDYRVRFRVKGKNVIVDKIGHRSDFYEE